MPSVTPAPHPQPHSPCTSKVNYRHRFNNDFKQKLKLKVKEEPSQVEGGYTFSLSVEWEGRCYSKSSQCRPTKEDAKEEACRLMVEALEELMAGCQESHTSVKTVGQPFIQAATPPMGRPIALSGSQPVNHDHVHVSRPPGAHVPVVMSRGAKKYQELLNECRQKVENAGGRWSLTGEPVNVAQTTFECQLKLELIPSAGATPMHFVSKSVTKTGRKNESKEGAAEELVGQLERSHVLKLQPSHWFSNAC